jgi:hypothetical protein
MENDPRIDRNRIAKCLKQDPILRASLGIRQDWTIVKRMGLLIGGWAIVLVATPLPENLLLSRIGLMTVMAAMGICWGVDILQNKLRIEDAADNLVKILKKDPKVTLITQGDETQIEHEKFQAECGTMTRLELKAMLDTEVEIREAVNALMEPKGGSLFGEVYQKPHTPKKQTRTRTKA